MQTRKQVNVAAAIATVLIRKHGFELDGSVCGQGAPVLARSDNPLGIVAFSTLRCCYPYRNISAIDDAGRVVWTVSRRTVLRWIAQADRIRDAIN